VQGQCREMCKFIVQCKGKSTRATKTAEFDLEFKSTRAGKVQSD